MVSDDRGQLLLVAGVLLALVIVASAVILNGIVDPGTSGTRGIASELDSLEGDSQPLRNDLEGLFEETTSRSPSAEEEALPYADRNDLNANIEAYRDVLFNVAASERGSVLQVGYNDGESLEGTIVFQQPSSSYNFTNNSQSGNWKLASGTESIPRARFNVSELPDTGTDAEINVTNGGGTRGIRLVFTETQVDLDFVQSGPSSRTLCSGLGADDSVVVEMRKPQNRTSAIYTVSSGIRHQCGTVELGNYVEPPFDVGIETGEQINGTYAVGLRGADETGVGSGSSSWPEEHDTPDTIVNPAFDVTYVSDGITYESTFTLYNRTRP